MTIRELREKKGMTMKELGEAAGISEGMVSLVERGMRTPGVKTAKRLAKVLGIRWTVFYPDEKKGA